MLITLWALGSLLPPLLYLVAMVLVWACVKERRVRNIALVIMALVPIGIGTNTANKVRAVSAAEDLFRSLCETLEKPTVHATALSVKSVFLDLRTPHEILPDTIKRADHTLLVEGIGQAMLQGVAGYPSIEQQTDKMPLRINNPDQRRQPISPGMPSSSHKVFWKSLDTSTEFVAKGTLALKQIDNDQVLAEFELIQLNTPSVGLLETGKSKLQLIDAKTRTCPSARQIAQLIKSVARTNPARAN